ncbi:hypothetical protein VP1G_10749 [Cytospora mali]|uniref:Uncharacterized protein n=1 Tax=Cytospora mali TaxID=578113 RepID=A0A194UUF6_CYTMA|nr:hypothetical protein VP1G_10749 [Valsa mali var. pyri (nom. inval.)]
MERNFGDSRRRQQGQVQGPMIDGSNDSSVHTPYEWYPWDHTQPELHTTSLDSLGHDRTFHATGLTGGGMNLPLAGFNDYVSPQDLSIGTVATLGPSGHLSQLSVGPGMDS